MSNAPEPQQKTALVDVNVIKAVRTPLAWFTLIALIIASILSAVAFRAEGQDFSILMVALLVILLALVLVFSYLLIRKPDVFGGRDGGRATGVTIDRSCLRERRLLPRLEEVGSDATEILLAGISLVSVIPPLSYLIEAKILSGCRLRVLLMHPFAPALQAWEEISRFAHAEGDILSSLNRIREIRMQIERKGGQPEKCEVRLSRPLAPFSMFGVNPDSPSGFLVVEFHCYKTALGERPHILLSPKTDERWFGFYREQFEALWEDASPWDPSINVTSPEKIELDPESDPRS